jgi:hypothetical protein
MTQSRKNRMRLSLPSGMCRLTHRDNVTAGRNNNTSWMSGAKVTNQTVCMGRV